MGCTVWQVWWHKAGGRRGKHPRRRPCAPESCRRTLTKPGVSRGCAPWTRSLGTFTGVRESTSSAGTRPGDLVAAKPALLRFHLSVKTACAPLRLLSPQKPLRWVFAGIPDARRCRTRCPRPPGRKKRAGSRPPSQAPICGPGGCRAFLSYAARTTCCQSWP